MTIAFVSNFLNHHQIPFCEELISQGVDFTFIATDNGSSQGYQNSCDAPYVVDYKENKAVVEDLVVNCDVLIVGACPYDLSAKRLKLDKLTFIYRERFFKNGVLHRFFPKARKNINEIIANYKNNKNLFVLCASGYLPYDLSFFGFDVSRCFKWGYFPAIDYDIDLDEHVEDTYLWVGRFLKLKHPEKVISLACEMKKNKKPFTITMIGDGPEKSNIEKLIDENDLREHIMLTGSLPVEKVESYYKHSKYFIQTSDFREGFGAVLYEAMAYGCIVFASSASGAAPLLVDNGVNGYLFSTYKNHQLYELVDEYHDSDVGKVAAKFIHEHYSHKIAAKRIIEFSKTYLDDSSIVHYDKGILSPAPLLKNNWI